MTDLDPDIVVLGTDDCCVAVAPRFQGRIFCAMNDALIHRLVPDLLRAPAGGPFKNLGGNSLWPAPEGGPFASFTPAAVVSSRDALLAPWSLEQFPGGDGVVAFARLEHAASAINTDFYGAPGRQPRMGDGYVAIELGGETKWQIGVTVASRPTLLGALDRKRGLLLLRRTRPQVGRYFNIADNDQPGGPWTAADLYSVFCGGSDGFFELETIAPMQTDAAGNLAPCTLSSETLIVQGGCSELEAYLEAHWGIIL